ncbi:MAG: hypothetical protein C3F07_12570 [Anaerolineales bacterium]|nr:MAG: hypothetical protein C3F07_12570 [Anaerolineales bacterium]
MTEKAINKLAEQELLSEILQTIKSGDEDARGFAVYEKVPLLRDKQAARGEFIKMLYFGTRLKKSKSGETLEVEEDGPEAWENSIIRSWAASAISVLDSNKDKAARLEVVKALQRETVNTTARYWILAALYKMSTRKDLETVVNETAARYKNAIMDGKNLSYESPDPINDRAAPLALAIQASWGDAEATTCLEVLLGSNSFTPMWSTCRALEMVSVRGLLGILTRVASDVRTWPDIRSRCVYAIGKIESPASIRSLGHILSNDQDALVREAAVDGLVNLGTSRTVKKLIEKTKNGSDGSPYSITSHLLGALLDQNAQIRYIAAKALFDVMLDRAPNDEDAAKIDQAKTRARINASEKVVNEIVKEQTELESGVPLLVDALRLIDPPEAESAAMVLSRYLFSEDVSVRQRAEKALRLVGGEKAVQTLMGQKSEVLRAYNDLLTKTDEPIQQLFQETMHQARFSFMVSQIMSIVVFVVGIGAIIFGLYTAFQSGNERIEFIFGAGTSIIGAIAVLLDLLVRDPHKRVQEATSILLRIKVIFLGYLRQIHQIDATFKHEFIEGGREFGQKDVEKTTRLINAVMKNTMNVITLHLPVRKTEKLAVDEVLKKWKEAVNLNPNAPEEEASDTTEQPSSESESKTQG